MDLLNKTPFHAFLFCGCVDQKSRMFGSLCARITYNLANNSLRFSESQPWNVSPGPYTAPNGTPMEGDELFYRGGVDLFIFGSARTPGAVPAPALDVSISAGKSFSHTIKVFGPRFWEKKFFSTAMTPPQPFTEIPLTIENAYGGKDEWDKLPVPFPSNPKGKGFVHSAATLDGKPLPLIEDPNHLIQSWQDQPQPVGVSPCPADCGPRVLDRIVFDDKSNALKELKPTFYNHAFPGMIAPPLHPGDPISISGVSHEGPVSFTLPDTPLFARVNLGKFSQEARLPIDQVGIDPDKKQVFITYRYPFRYTINPLEKRSCELLYLD